MGKTHALSGVTIALGYTALGLPYAPTAWPSIAAFAVVTAGGAMLPDLDHPQSSAARSWGPLTRLLARLVARVSGGHRHGTHTAACALLVGVLAHAAGLAGGWWLLVPLFLAASLALGTVMGGLRNEVAAAGLAVSVHLGEVDARWLGVALGIGCLAHCLGDLLTPERFRFLWPLPHRMALGLFTTGKPREAVFAGLLAAGNVALMVTLADGWPLATGLAWQAVGA